MPREEQNPYESPRHVGPPEQGLVEKMNALRAEFEHRYSQLFSDGVMATEFSAVFGLLAWEFSKDPRVAGGVAVATTVAIGIGAFHDLLSKAAAFPSRMNALRARATEEWLGRKA
jgi:hypothetical protein